MTQTKCPVCEAILERAAFQSFELCTARGERTWTRCPTCRSYFDVDGYDVTTEVNHTRQRPWGQLESGLDLNEFKYQMFSSVLQLLKKHAAPGKTLLDIGCSFGGFLFLAKLENYDVQGMDIVPEAVEYVKKQGIACRTASSVASLGAGENSMDIVTALDCNFYWPDQATELRAIRRVMRPGGLLAMRLVDKSWMLSFGLAARKLVPGIGAKICRAATNDHRVSIPVRPYLKLLQDEGFEVIYRSPKGALHSKHTRLPVKVAFGFGSILWRLSARNFAPGFLILARKPNP